MIALRRDAVLTRLLHTLTSTTALVSCSSSCQSVHPQISYAHCASVCAQKKVPHHKLEQCTQAVERSLASLNGQMYMSRSDQGYSICDHSPICLSIPMFIHSWAGGVSMPVTVLRKGRTAQLPGAPQAGASSLPPQTMGSALPQGPLPSTAPLSATPCHAALASLETAL